MADEKELPVIVDGVECRTIKEMILYKMDRTIAVVGVVILGAWALSKAQPDAYQISMAAVGGLVGYIGGRTGK